MTHSEWLLRRAETYWRNGARLPIDLFVKMLNEGIDVDTVERKFKSSLEN